MDSLSTSEYFFETISRDSIIGIVGTIVTIAGIIVSLWINKKQNKKKRINNVKPKPSGKLQVELCRFILSKGKCSHEEILKHSGKNPHATNRSLIKMTARKILTQKYENGEVFYELS